MSIVYGAVINAVISNFLDLLVNVVFLDASRNGFIQNGNVSFVAC